MRPWFGTLADLVIPRRGRERPVRGVSDVDHVLASALGRLAVETGLVQRAGRPAAANLLRECVEQIIRMADQCQLQEFTEHGLSHIASLVDRIDSWTTSRGVSLVNALTNDEAFLLLFAVITHDIGMLSQRESDLPEQARTRFAMVFADLPVWVRRTHVHRIEAILRRTLGQRYRDFVDS
ncbi:MAG: hypothetical protein H5T92_07300, partial [Synergistales bacterium]|nr:hypothetical protein [Synergistales bacterium]